MKKVAVVGYGNIGRYVVEAVRESNDMEMVGIIRRKVVGKIPEFPNIKVVENIEDLQEVDVVILTVPSRHSKENAIKYLELGINTVDSFDMHSQIYDNLEKIDRIAKKNEAVSIISAGWDPGTDSIVRALMLACSPIGETYTNFGPGMSMGHSVVVKNLKGVEDALAVTIPTGTGIHRRIVYVQMDGTASFEEIERNIKKDVYFINDETHVKKVDDVSKYKDLGHGVLIERKGVSGKTSNQKFQFNMSINNPALTAQVLCSSARATFNQSPGAYTLIEIPIIDLLEGSREEIIRRIV